ncbi:MAG: guanylate kinase [Deltaproteobacteria bacterium]|nr:guanylate kinase [Deltaproteobacteria bacterium]
MASHGLLLILSAPSGAGKTTLAHRLLAAEPSARFSISYTTRPPRGQEQDGRDYHFVDEPTFRQMIARGELLEWAQVHGNLYGSHESTVDEAQAGHLVVFDIDVQGGNSIKAKHPESVSVFVLPPSMSELERRLRDRQTDSDEIIRRRLAVAAHEMEAGCATYDYLIVNDSLERAFADLCAIVRAERCRRTRASFPWPWASALAADANHGVVPKT